MIDSVRHLAGWPLSGPRRRTRDARPRVEYTAAARFASARRSEQILPRQLRRLPDPTRQALLIDPLILVDVEVPHLLVFRLARRDRPQRRPAEESHLHVLREAMEVEEPPPPLDAIKRRVPPHGLP